MKRAIFFIFALYITLHNPIFSEEDSGVSWNKKILWDQNLTEIVIKAPLNIKDSTLSSARMKSETWIKDNLTNIFFKNILDIDINSLENIGDVINRDPQIYYLLEALGESLNVEESKLTVNLEYIETKYSFPIYPDFLSLFYNQSEYKKIYKKLDHREYGKFTGLIIYVPESLPLYQKRKNGELVKVLFPKVFNEDMDLIIDYTMVDKEYMKKWGIALYGNSFNESKYQERIGISPLRITAKGLFGKKNSDIIISNKDAKRLIGSEFNLKIISQARILILN